MHVILFESLITVCLDGTLPGYHLHRGHGSGANSWLIQLEVSKGRVFLEIIHFHFLNVCC